MLKNAVALAKAGSVREAFKNEEGAIDLASIMVGIIVIGIIGGVIAATVFAVIPWAQDKAAQDVLNSVATAESAYRGFTAEEGTSVFGTEAELAAPALDASTDPLFTDSDNKVAIRVDADGQGYQAYSKSATNRVFVSVDGGKAAVASNVPTDVTAELG